MLRLAALMTALLVLARAQPPEPAHDPFGRITPYGCVVGFLKTAAERDYERAAEYLDLRAANMPGPELARQLKLVLDLGLSGNLNSLSRAPQGDLTDGLTADRERAGSVRTEWGPLEIELEQVKRAGEPAIWLFSASTLRGIPRTFAAIKPPAFDRFIPSPLKVPVGGAPLWRWLTSLFGLAVAYLSAPLIARALIPLLKPAVRRLSGGEDGPSLTSITWPVRLLLLAVIARLFSFLSLSLLIRQLWQNAAFLFATLGFSWMAAKFGGAVANLNTRRLLRLKKFDKIAMLALARRMFNIAVFLIAVVILLHRAGVNVTAMLAGLGVGGIALALAAQKTLENVFGGISVIMQEVIRVGDVCQISGQVGTVEDIGLGMTRLRTPDRTLLAIPNAQLSQLNLENLSMRDKFWFHQTFGLRYDTSAEQIRTVLEGAEQLLRTDSAVESSTARIRFIAFGASSMTLEIYAYILQADYDAFLRVQQRLLLGVLDVIAAAGTSVASPLLMPQPPAGKNVEQPPQVMKT